jgi:hypothetical protein
MVDAHEADDFICAQQRDTHLTPIYGLINYPHYSSRIAAILPGCALQRPRPIRQHRPSPERKKARVVFNQLSNLFYQGKFLAIARLYPVTGR